MKKDNWHHRQSAQSVDIGTITIPWEILIQFNGMFVRSREYIRVSSISWYFQPMVSRAVFANLDFRMISSREIELTKLRIASSWGVMIQPQAFDSKTRFVTGKSLAMTGTPHEMYSKTLFGKLR